MEARANRADDYKSLVQCIKGKFPRLLGKDCNLFRPSGARVLNEDIMIKGVKRSWTLGLYLQYLHTSPEVLKLGIGYDAEGDTTSDEEFSDETRPVTIKLYSSILFLLEQ